MIFDTNKSYTKSEITEICMNNQTDPVCMRIYLKYLSKNSVRPISPENYYFVIVDDANEPILKKDRDKKVHVDKVKLYKIWMSIRSKYRGYIIIASKKHPSIIKNIMVKKKYRRNVQESIEYITHCDPDTCKIIKNNVDKKYDEMLSPGNKLFIYVEGEVRDVSKNNGEM